MDELKPEDLSFSAYPETIAGGMHVGMPNGVLATHLPTGIKVVCNHYRSQHQNRDACLLAIASALNTRAASGGDDAVLEWISGNLLGQNRDYAIHVMKRGGTGDAGDLRSFVVSMQGKPHD